MVAPHVGVYNGSVFLHPKATRKKSWILHAGGRVKTLTNLFTVCEN